MIANEEVPSEETLVDNDSNSEDLCSVTLLLLPVFLKLSMTFKTLLYASAQEVRLKVKKII